MSSLEVLEPIFKFLPEVKSPVHNEDFNEKLKWTALIFVLYYFFATIFPPFRFLLIVTH